jgi:chromosome segregation ATPase
MSSIEQRVSYIEGKLDSLATKADLAQEIGKLDSKISQLEVKIERMTWVQLSSVVAAAGVIVAILRLWN